LPRVGNGRKTKDDFCTALRHVPSRLAKKTRLLQSIRNPLLTHKALGIERPKVRQSRSVHRLNTLTYIVINVKALARARAINASLLTPKLGKVA
jgi:hypothetical protein